MYGEFLYKIVLLTMRIIRIMIKMKDKELVRLLQNHGWTLDRIHGSRYILIKNGQTISVPVHGRDMKKGLELAILKKAGLK